jgi:hypothetical protein
VGQPTSAAQKTMAARKPPFFFWPGGLLVG